MLKITCYASGSSGNCYLLQNEKTNILLECGVNKFKLRSFLQEHNLLIPDLDCCLVSHLHNDHSESIEYVCKYIDTYSTYEVAEKWKRVKRLEILKPLKIGTIKIVPIPVEHGMCENNAFVFLDKDSCIFFGTDFSIMTQNVKNFKFNEVFIECNYSDEILQSKLNNQNEEMRNKYVRQVNTHMSKENCKKHLRYMDLSCCKKITLIHHSLFLINQEQTIKEFEEEFGVETIFAKKGM